MRLLALAAIILLVHCNTQFSIASDTPPKPLSCEVDYPAALQGLNESGSVTVELVIKPDGTTTRIKVLDASHPILADAAKASVKNWTFVPATKDGKPVASLVRQEIKYDASKWLDSKKESKTSFGKFLKKQNEAIKGARLPTNTKALRLERDLFLRFERGLISTTFTVELPKGEYKPVVETDEGVFYLAQAHGFRYEKYLLGGVYRPKNGERDMVWYMIHVDPRKMREKLHSGEQIKKMRSGLMNLQNRPTIEPDFEIPSDAFKF